MNRGGQEQCLRPWRKIRARPTEVLDAIDLDVVSRAVGGKGHVGKQIAQDERPSIGSLLGRTRRLHREASGHDSVVIAAQLGPRKPLRNGWRRERGLLRLCDS